VFRLNIEEACAEAFRINASWSRPFGATCVKPAFDARRWSERLLSRSDSPQNYGSPPLRARKNFRQFREFSHLQSSFRDAHSPRGPTAQDTAGRPCLGVPPDDGSPSRRVGALDTAPFVWTGRSLGVFPPARPGHVGRWSREASTERRAGLRLTFDGLTPPRKWMRVCVPRQSQAATHSNARSLGILRCRDTVPDVFAARSVNRTLAPVNCGFELMALRTNSLAVPR
jgi:hypothetical protein